MGESGCGKSVSALSLMRLIPNPPGRISAGEIIFDGRDLLKLNDEQIRRVRQGDRHDFPGPMTSLNPVLTIGRQISEALELHENMNSSQARERTSIELLELVGIPSARSRVNDYPHQFSGGMRQRVMIAMALSCTSCLSPMSRPQLWT